MAHTQNTPGSNTALRCPALPQAFGMATRVGGG